MTQNRKERPIEQIRQRAIDDDFGLHIIDESEEDSDSYGENMRERPLEQILERSIDDDFGLMIIDDEDEDESDDELE